MSKINYSIHAYVNQQEEKRLHHNLNIYYISKIFRLEKQTKGSLDTLVDYSSLLFLFYSNFIEFLKILYVTEVRS